MITLYNYILFDCGKLRNLINNIIFRYYKEDVFKLWREKGFTLHCEEIDAVILSNVFEELSIFLNLDVHECCPMDDNIIFYAIARRLYDEYKIILLPIQLVSVVKRIYPKITEEEREFYWKKFNIDIDAEACIRVAKIIGSYFKKGI